MSEKIGWQHQKSVVTFKNFFIVLKIRADMLKKSQRVAKNLEGVKSRKKSKNRQKCERLKNMFKKHVLQHIFYSADLQTIKQK